MTVIDIFIIEILRLAEENRGTVRLLIEKL
jgi:hypothetical protein